MEWSLAKKSLWTQPISNSILRFSDDNVLAQLWSKWLVRKCMKKEDFETTPDRLSLYNYNGVFVLVAAGILISILFLGFERKVASYRAKRKEIVHGLERKDGGSKETLTDYFVDKFPSTITRLNSGTENNNVKSLSQLNFASSNSVLKLERCDDAQESKGLKFNSIC
ncbi:Glutamate receptor ionotropic, NMDA 2B [Desmophyllum pertusum]|uniref:Glutamate receptor ionotropic, NMDA 2B n=1 Tax=Desmophyllum pertusum TaxID=174260 RepID=A0A9X0CQV1_9CNID|nr:Glutamate receptor ionotropic, NMDA 2B [Desmophyllum pertusum]